MPAQDLLSLGYNVAEFDKQTAQILERLNSIKAAAKDVDGTIINLSNFSGGVKDFKKSADDLVKTQAALTAETEKYNKVVLQQVKLKEAEAKATKAQVQADNEVIKQIGLEADAEKKSLTYKQALEREKARGLSQSKAEEKIAEQLTNEYYQLGQALKDAENKYKNLYIVAGKDNPQTKAALQNALATRKILNDIDQSLGNYQRNVGNYASGFNGLNTSVQQILRETPSAVNSLNTFFLAISNNLPILFDEIQKASAGMATLKEEAEAANIALAAQSALQKNSAAASEEANDALSTQIETVVSSIGASQEQAVALKEQVTSMIASGTATEEAALATANNTEQLVLNAGASVEDAAALRAQVIATSAASRASNQATVALEAQTVATVEANAAAAAQPSILKRIGSSLFSFQSALTLGVLALTLFGGKIIDWVSSLFKASDALDVIAEKQEDLNKALEDNGVKTVVEDIERLKVAVDSAKNGLIDKEKVVKEYNETLGDTLGTAKDFNDVEDVMSDTARLNAYVKAMLYRAAANLALQKAAEAALKAEEDRRKKTEEFATIGTRLTTAGQVSAPGFVPGLNDVNAGIAARSKAAKKAQDEAVKLSEDAQKKQEDIAKSFFADIDKLTQQFNLNFNPLGDDKKTKAKTKKSLDETFLFIKNELENQIKELQDFVDNGTILFDERFASAKEEADKEIALSKLVMNEDIKNGKGRVLAEQENAFRIEDINKKLAANLQKINQDRAKNPFPEPEITAPVDTTQAEIQKQIEAAKKVNDELIRIIKDAGEDRANIIAQEQAEANTKLNDEYAKGLINAEDYEKGKRDLAIKYGKEATEAAIHNFEAQLEIAKQSDPNSDKVRELTALIAKLKEQLSQLGVNIKKTHLEELQDALQKIADVTNNITQAFTALADVNFNNQKAHLEELGAQEEKNYEQEQRNIENSTQSIEEKAHLQTLLDAKHAAQQEDLARRQREIDNKKAEFDKAVGILNIIVNTAAAVVKALPNVPLAVAVGALGAAQLAAAIATKVPHYEKGTHSAKEGFALTDEKGAELYVERSGDMFIGNDKPTLRYLKAGTQVIPHDEVNQFLYNAMLKNTGRSIQAKESKKDLIDLDRLGNVIAKSMKHQKRPYTKVINNIGNDIDKLLYIKRNIT